MQIYLLYNSYHVRKFIGVFKNGIMPLKMLLNRVFESLILKFLNNLSKNKQFDTEITVYC